MSKRKKSSPKEGWGFWQELLKFAVQALVIVVVSFVLVHTVHVPPDHVIQFLVLLLK